MMPTIENKPNQPSQYGQKGRYLAPLLLLAFTLLAGCSGDDMEDLKSYIAQVKARPASKIPPLPTFETYVTVPYAAAHLRDPFAPFMDMPDKPEGPGAGTGAKPPITHKPEPLEKFPLDGLKFVGILERNNERWAIITAPDKLVHRVKVGNYLGQNYGRITSISETRIELMETVADSQGSWVERPAALSVEE